MKHWLMATTLCVAGLVLTGCTIVVEAPPDAGFTPGGGGPGNPGGGGAGGISGNGGNIGKEDGGNARCGNLICEAGEDCSCPDCPCNGTCGQIGDRFYCGEACPTGECANGERCFEGFAAFNGPACLPDFGETEIGDACSNSLDCGTGLVCSCTDGWNCSGGSVCVEECDDSCDFCEEKRWGTRVCQRDCGPENPDACGPGTACRASATNTGCTRTPTGPWVCYPRQTAYLCGAGEPPAFGEPCGRGRSCGVDEVCVGTDCEETPEGVGCDTYQCSRPCQTDDDCEAPQGVCWRASSRDLGFCVPSL